MTAKEWRDAHPDLKGNIRDYANVSQLVCLSNLENLNAVFINEGIPQAERLVKLNAIAISQMKVLTEDHRLLQLDEVNETESQKIKIPCNKSSFPCITRMTGDGSLCSVC